MNVSISNSSSNSGSTQAVAATPSPANAQPSEVSQPPAQAADDSVKLSQAAQVHLYKQQGQSPSQIATSLGISAATVDGYLNIAVPKAPAAPVAATPTAPSPEPAAAQAPAAPTPVAGK
jgi:DNA-binding NarL/FixJ family response regulator